MISCISACTSCTRKKGLSYGIHMRRYLTYRRCQVYSCLFHLLCYNSCWGSSEPKCQHLGLGKRCRTTKSTVPNCKNGDHSARPRSGCLVEKVAASNSVPSVLEIGLVLAWGTTFRCYQDTRQFQFQPQWSKLWWSWRRRADDQRSGPLSKPNPSPCRSLPRIRPEEAAILRNNIFERPIWHELEA